MDIKNYFDFGVIPVKEPLTDSPRIGSVFLVSFVERFERRDTGVAVAYTIALPSYGILYEKHHQIGCLCMVTGETTPYGIVWEWLPDCVRHYKTHYLGDTPFHLHQFIEKANSILSIYGSYHRVWWHADKLLTSLVHSTILKPVDAGQKWPNIESKINIDMPDDLIGIQRYDDDSYKPSNPEEVSVAVEYRRLSTTYIMMDANRRLPRSKGRCVLL